MNQRRVPSTGKDLARRAEEEEQEPLWLRQLSGQPVDLLVPRRVMVHLHVADIREAASCEERRVSLPKARRLDERARRVDDRGAATVVGR